MQQNIEDLTIEIIKLNKRERLEIVRFLLFLDNMPSNSENIDSAWEKEIADRINAVDDGTAIGIDYFEAIKNIESHLAS